MMGRQSDSEYRSGRRQRGTPKGTLLFDAIYLAANEKLKSEVGRKALILITDGDDQGSTYNFRMRSKRRRNRTRSSTASTTWTAVSIAQRHVGRRRGEGDLRKMSEETGGHVFKVGFEASAQRNLQARSRTSCGTSTRSATRSTNPNARWNVPAHRDQGRQPGLPGAGAQRLLRYEERWRSSVFARLQVFADRLAQRRHGRDAGRFQLAVG